MESSTTRNPVHFSRKMAEIIMEEVKKEGWNFSAFLTGGGEPLMHPELLEVTDTLGGYEKTLYVGMVTSGFLEKDVLRKKNLQDLLQRPYASEAYIELSFNLYHPSFIKRFENVMKLLYSIKKESLINIRLCCSFENCKHSWAELEKAIRSVAKELGGDYYEFPAGIYDDEQPDFSIVENELNRGGHYLNWIVEAESFLFSRVYIIRDRSDGGIVLNIRPITLNKEGRGKNIKEEPWASFLCDIFRDNTGKIPSLFIYSDGSVYPECCPSVKHMRLGKIGENSLAEMIQKRDLFFQRILGRILNDRHMFERGTLEVCQLCQKLVAEGGFELR